MRYLKDLLICTVIGLAATCAIHAQPTIPRLISYQGVLTDDSGTPLPSPQKLTVTIYDMDDNERHSETHQGVKLDDNGVFSITIGRPNASTATQLPASLAFDVPYQIGIAVGDAAELTPRTLLTSAPYALNAVHSVTADRADESSRALVADSLRGFTPASSIPTDVPVGTIVAYYGEIREGSTVDMLKQQGWLFCDGEPFDDDDFPLLRALLGNESTPDLRGLFLRGANQNRRGDQRTGTFADPDYEDRESNPGPSGHPGSTSGQMIGSVQRDLLGVHTHEIRATHSINGVASSDHTLAQANNPNSSFNTQATGGAETRPVNVYINWIIKAR